MKAEQQILNLLGEILQVIKATSAIEAPKLPKGIFAHQSKYNPWRGYVWDAKIKKSIYLGAFPIVNKAKAAQTAYRKGQAVASGTKAVLTLLKTA